MADISASTPATALPAPASTPATANELRAFDEGAAAFVDAGRGKIHAVGNDVLDLLNRLSTNKVDHLKPGEGAPTILTNEKGRIIDLVYALNLGPYVLLLTGAGAQSPVMEWLDRYTFMEDSTLSDVTDSTLLVTLAGPQARAVLESATGLNLASLHSFQSASFEADGISGYAIRMDLGDRAGYWAFLEDGDVAAFLQKLLDCGATSVGGEAWESFRIGSGIPSYGKEISEDRNPLEAGLIGAIDFTKGCYIGQEVIARLDTYDKVQRALVSLKVGGHGQWQAGDNLAQEGRSVGTITSLAYDPATGSQAGLGYVRLSEAVTGTRFEGKAGDGRWAEVVAVPKLFGD